MFNNAIHHPLMALDQPTKDKDSLGSLHVVKISDKQHTEEDKGRGTKRHYPDKSRQPAEKKLPTPLLAFPKVSLVAVECGHLRNVLQQQNYVQLTARPELHSAPKLVLSDGSPWEKVSRAILLKCGQHQQKPETLQRKLGLREFVEHLIKMNLPFCRGLHVVGSTVTGFGCETSDVDFCLYLTLKEMDQRFEALRYLYEVQRALSQCQFLSKFEIIRAKVPILRFSDVQNNLEVDLNCNNLVGIRNTMLLCCYSQIDTRVRPLVLIVKLWARHHGINDAKQMTLSSYSLTLMVIHFLQTKPKPAILPCLQTLYPDLFYPKADLCHITPPSEVEMRKLRSNNPASLGALFACFLQYYAEEFDYENHAISVRLGGVNHIKNCRYFISPKNDPNQWKYLCIEEPFDRTNTARAVFDPVSFQKIISVFKDSAKKLKATKSLASILP